MELFDNLALGLATAASWQNLLFCFAGVMIGTLVGVLPGISPLTTVAMLLPFTFGLSPASALIMLAGIFYGAQYGSSTAAILVNVPGETSSIVTCIDGHQMARQGRAGPALAIAAIASFFAGTIATLVIAHSQPAAGCAGAQIHGRRDRKSPVILGLLGAVVLAHGSPTKAIAMIIVGRARGAGRCRRQFRRPAHDVRHPRYHRRHQLRAHCHRPVRHRRDDPQPRAAAGP